MAFAEPVCHIVTPVGNLGYGFDNNGLQTLLRNLTTSTTPTVMIFNSFREENGHETKGMPVGLRASYLRDVQKLLRCVSSRRVPLIINVAPVEARGGHLDTIAEMVEETARSSPQNLKVEKIEKCQLKSLPSPIDGSPEPERCITPRTIGGVVETFFEKIDATQDLDVLLSTSPSRLVPFMAFTSHCLKNLQLPSEQCSASAARVKGGVLHMAKLLEQGGVCCAPKCAGAVGTLYSDGSFEVAPVGAKSRCTSISVSSYILQSPSRLDVPELGGKLDLTQISYEQLEDCRSVRVQGSLILKAMESEQRMRERLERPYRAVYLGRITDAFLMNQIDEALQRVRLYVQAQQPHYPVDSWHLSFNVYGRNTPEIIVMGEVTAISYDIARSIAEIARMASQLGFGLKHPGVELPDDQICVSEMFGA